MDKANLDRINALSAIARERELTAEEQAERQRCREAYIKAFRGQMRMQLDNTVVEYPDGSRKSLKDAAKNGKN